MQFTLDLTLADDADPMTVADMLLTLLFNQPDEALPGIDSIDGCEPTGG